MARPHVEFIHAQVLPWQRGLPGGARDDLEARILSRDEADGESTVQLRYPAGWRRDEAEHLDVDEELFVLDGALEIGGVRYGRHDYAHLPAGFTRETAASPDGAVVLTFLSGEAHARPGAGEHDERRLVRRIDSRRMPSHTGPRKHMNSEGFSFAGTAHKLLRQDPDTGEVTWLVGMMPTWSSGKMETHPVVEEEFSLGGDLVTPHGTMRPGAYFWRPPNIRHGPFGTVSGTLHICRCRGGPFSTVFAEEEREVDWDTPYDPILPDAYRAHLDGAVDCEPNY